MHFLELSEDVLGSVARIANKLVVKLRWWHMIILFMILTLYWLAALNHSYSRKEIESTGGARLQAFEKELSGKHGPLPTNPTDFDLTLNPLVRATASVLVGWNYDGETYIKDLYLNNTGLRTENLILMVGLCFGAIIALAAVKPSNETSVIHSVSSVTIPSKAEGVSAVSKTAEQTLSDDVAAAEDRAADMYRRSTFLLAGGILMAFVGVSVFAFTAPSEHIFENVYETPLLSSIQIEPMRPNAPNESSDPIPERSTSDELRLKIEQLRSQIEQLRRRVEASLAQPRSSVYALLLARSMRPFGMLIFVEGIAWFLLRQYRSLIEDYKAFVRISIKRSNYLIALKAAPTTQRGTPLADVINVLLTEDLTGRLAKDQTTEALEAVKDRDQGPILEALKELKDLVKIRGAGA